jgi:hypothetical protein
LFLSKPDIETYIKKGKIKFTPEISFDSIEQVSVDLRLGNKFTVLKDPPPYLTSIRIDKSLWTSMDLWEHREEAKYVFKGSDLGFKYFLGNTYIVGPVYDQSIRYCRKKCYRRYCFKEIIFMSL